MKYSQQVLNMLKRGVDGDVDDYYDFFLELTAKLGEDEAFADGLIAENEPFLTLSMTNQCIISMLKKIQKIENCVGNFLNPITTKQNS